jgi:hypothetical protein
MSTLTFSTNSVSLLWRNGRGRTFFLPRWTCISTFIRYKLRIILYRALILKTFRITECSCAIKFHPSVFLFCISNALGCLFLLQIICSERNSYKEVHNPLFFLLSIALLNVVLLCSIQINLEKSHHYSS